MARLGRNLSIPTGEDIAGPHHGGFMPQDLDYYRQKSYQKRVYTTFDVCLVVTTLLGICMAIFGRLTGYDGLWGVGWFLTLVGPSTRLTIRFVQTRHQKACETEQDYEEEYHERRRARQDAVVRKKLDVFDDEPPQKGH